MSKTSESSLPGALDVNDDQTVTDSKQYGTLSPDSTGHISPPSGRELSTNDGQGSSDHVSMDAQAGSFICCVPSDEFPTGPVTGPIQQPSREDSSSDEETVFEVVPMGYQRVNDREEAVDAGTQERIINRQFRDNRLSPGNVDGSQRPCGAQESVHVGINSPQDNRTNRAFVSSERHDAAIPEQHENNSTENLQHENHDSSSFSANQNNDAANSGHQESAGSSNAPNIQNSNIGSSTDSKVTMEQSGNVKNNDQASFRPTGTLILRLIDSDKSSSSETSSSDESLNSLTEEATEKPSDDIENFETDAVTSNPTSPSPSETEFVIRPMHEEQNLNEQVTGEEQRVINTLDNSFGQSLDSSTDIYSPSTAMSGNDFPTGPYTGPVQQPASTGEQTHISSEDDIANMVQENNSANSRDDSRNSSEDDTCQFIVVSAHHDYSTESCNLPDAMALANNNYPTNENIILAHPEDDQHHEGDSSLS